MLRVKYASRSTKTLHNYNQITLLTALYPYNIVQTALNMLEYQLLDTLVAIAAK